MFKKKYDVYIASPFFNDEQNAIVDRVEEILAHYNLTFFSPRSMNRLEPYELHDKEKRYETFMKNLETVEDCSFMIAIPHNKDMGTVFEAGYAFARNIPMIYYAPFLDKKASFNLMLAESGEFIVRESEDLDILMEAIVRNDEDKLSEFKQIFTYKGAIE